MGPTRLDRQIFACLCTGIKSDRDPMALHEILLVTVFSLCFFPMFIRGDRTGSHPCRYRIHNRLSDSIEYAKVYVHLLSLATMACRSSRVKLAKMATSSSTRSGPVLP